MDGEYNSWRLPVGRTPWSAAGPLAGLKTRSDLAKAGKPVERLIPYRESAKPRKPGSMAGEIWMAEDFDMLPDDIAESLGVHKSGE